MRVCWSCQSDVRCWTSSNDFNILSAVTSRIIGFPLSCVQMNVVMFVYSSFVVKSFLCHRLSVHSITHASRVLPHRCRCYVAVAVSSPLVGRGGPRLLEGRRPIGHRRRQPHLPRGEDDVRARMASRGRAASGARRPSQSAGRSSRRVSRARGRRARGSEAARKCMFVLVYIVMCTLM